MAVSVLQCRLLPGLSLGVMLLGLLFLVGCGERVETGPLVEESRSIDLGDAETVRANIEMGAGKLRIEGGSASLMEADFTYNVPAWKPVIEYSISGRRGDLKVRMPHDEGYTLSRGVKYEWDIALSDDVLMDMTVELGAGESRLDLASLQLERLKVSTGAGAVYVDLGGSLALTRLDMETGAGSVEVDLTGHWDHDLDAEISGGIGKIKLLLPSSVGVRVDASKGLGKVSAKGLVKSEGDYVNEAYGRSDVTLSIDVEAGIGAIDLEVAEPRSPEGTVI